MKYFATKNPQITQREIEHKSLVKELAGECVVLLDNDGVLPLSAAGEIALFGNGARNTIKGGTGSGDVNTRDNKDIADGLTESGFHICTNAWLVRQNDKRIEDKKAYLEWLKRFARENNKDELIVGFEHPFKEQPVLQITEDDVRDLPTDTAIYVLARNSGEGADRLNEEGDYKLYEQELDNIKLLAKRFDKFILVLNIGGVIDMSEIKAIDGISSIVLMSQLGNIGGPVLADILLGKVNPSGKLTDTWAYNYMDYPSSASFGHNNGNLDDEYYTEGIYVGYRYFDTFNIKPIYPFGYGLSYTHFEVETVEADLNGSTVTLSIAVTNTGNKYWGKEVVQVYYSAPQTDIQKPVKELVAYHKTELIAPNEKVFIDIRFDLKNMASYSEKEAAWILEKGEYVISVGTSSANVKDELVIDIKDDKIISKLKKLFADTDPVKEIIAPEVTRVINPLIRKVSVDNIDNLIDTETVEYKDKRPELTDTATHAVTMDDVKKGKNTLEELVAQLSIEEMATICVGTLRLDTGSIVGNAAETVPGAAGETTSLLKETRGIKNMVLADGPAGLRLQPVFKTTKDGTKIKGGDILGDVIEPFPENLDESEVDTYYQYCTAIPIGWALAQSFNLELIEKAGEMIGAEMELFGVDSWLAPALNIHRNPLCGRNFEYYSEDPLISGNAAAAITNGVQKHKGKYTTIKHFAANNQEDNRYFTNAHISERALREIYLKGFEIAVKESKPCSIMSSYNLLNGVHTANSYDLLESVARDEWKFEGYIMTDWFTSQDVPMLTDNNTYKYSISSSVGCIYAGNDLQMPGCQKNVDDIVDAVKNKKRIDGYEIGIGDLQHAVLNILRVVDYSS